jgi:hypothetical protein
MVRIWIIFKFRGEVKGVLGLGFVVRIEQLRRRRQVGKYLKYLCKVKLSRCVLNTCRFNPSKLQ